MKILIAFDDIPEDSELYKTYKSHKITIEYPDAIVDTVALNNAVSKICNIPGVEVFKDVN